MRCATWSSWAPGRRASSAAVYAASEGLDVLVLEANAPGGQAGSSSKIENYLGFPTGISGQALAGRAFTQAQKFGANVRDRPHREAAGLRAGGPTRWSSTSGERFRARAIIIASGARYRRLAMENLARFEGAGVYYGATFVESQAPRGRGGDRHRRRQLRRPGRRVPVAASPRHVHMLVRAGGLADTMSRYLIRRIEESPAITLRTRHEIVGLRGDGELSGCAGGTARPARSRTRPVRHVFCMMGADPCTGWLEGCVALDEKGFVKTGQDLTRRGSGRQRLAALPPPPAPGDLAARASSPSGTCARGT